MSLALHLNGRCTSLLRAARLRNDLYCVEWDVKLYYTIPYHCVYTELVTVSTLTAVCLSDFQQVNCLTPKTLRLVQYYF